MGYHRFRPEDGGSMSLRNCGMYELLNGITLKTKILKWCGR